MRRRFALLFSLILMSPLSAQAFTAVNLLEVDPVDRSSFEVVLARGEGARGVWCAAADYALATADDTRHLRLYLKRGIGPSVTAPGRRSVVFTSDPGALEGEQIESYSLTIRQPGYSLRVFHAHAFCKDYIEDRRN